MKHDTIQSEKKKMKKEDTEDFTECKYHIFYTTVIGFL